MFSSFSNPLKKSSGQRHEQRKHWNKKLAFLSPGKKAPIFEMFKLSTNATWEVRKWEQKRNFRKRNPVKISISSWTPTRLTSMTTITCWRTEWRASRWAGSPPWRPPTAWARPSTRRRPSISRRRWRTSGKNRPQLCNAKSRNLSKEKAFL